MYTGTIFCPSIATKSDGIKPVGKDNPTAHLLTRWIQSNMKEDMQIGFYRLGTRTQACTHANTHITTRFLTRITFLNQGQTISDSL